MTHGPVDEEVQKDKKAPTKEELDLWYAMVGPTLLDGYASLHYVPGRRDFRHI